MAVDEAPRRRVPGWAWVVVPMVLSALVFGALTVAVRSSGDDEDDAISGPAGQLPAVVAAAQDLLGTVPPEAELPAELGRGVRRGHARRSASSARRATTSPSPTRFDRLPDAEARLLGRTLGEIQTQLSPTEVDGCSR